MMPYNQSTPLSQNCLTVVGEVQDVIDALTQLTRQFREAWEGIDSISQQLHSIQTALYILRDDAELLQWNNAAVEGVQTTISSVRATLYAVSQLIHEYKPGGLPRTRRWETTGSSEAHRLQTRLRGFHRELMQSCRSVPS
jgi:hypothetical protein